MDGQDEEELEEEELRQCYRQRSIRIKGRTRKSRRKWEIQEPET